MTWATKRLDELGRVVTGKTPATANPNFYGGEYMFVTPSDLEYQSYYVTDTQTTVTDVAHDSHNNQFIPRDSVMFTCIGSTIGKCGISSDECLTNQQINSIVVNGEHNPKFIYYLLNRYRPLIRGIGLSGGAAQPIINKSTFSSVKVRAPDRRTQDGIADILSAYDDLIENNRRRIALLEEAARLLYREWFVHFRFPGHEHVTVNNGIPEGWERFALSELAVFVNGYAFKPAQLSDTGLPIVKIPELRQGVTEKTPRNDGELIPEKYHLKDGDLLFSWSGTLAVNVWASGPALLNQHLFKVVPTGRVGSGLLMCAIREALAAFDNQTVGATMKHIRRSALDRVFVTLGDRAFTAPVEDTLYNTYAQLIILHQQNQKLAQARDLLLPRMMNGEVAV